jgi:hypothetical protein
MRKARFGLVFFLHWNYQFYKGEFTRCSLQFQPNLIIVALDIK